MNTGMRFCKYCGMQISEQDSICPACGKDLNPIKISQPAPGPDAGHSVHEPESDSGAISPAGAEIGGPEGTGSVFRKMQIRGVQKQESSRIGLLL